MSYTDCPQDYPIPDGLGRCIACEACSLLSYPPSGCVLCGSLSTSTKPETTTLSQLTSAFANNPTATVATDPVSSDVPVLELVIVAAVLVLALVIFCVLTYLKQRKQEPRCTHQGYERCPTCVDFNVDKNTATTRVVGNVNDVAVDIEHNENDGIEPRNENTEFDDQPPQVHGQDSLQVDVTETETVDVDHGISCSSHVRGDHPIHGPNPVSKEDDMNCETVMS